MLLLCNILRSSIYRRTSILSSRPRVIEVNWKNCRKSGENCRRRRCLTNEVLAFFRSIDKLLCRQKYARQVISFFVTFFIDESEAMNLTERCWTNSIKRTQQHDRVYRYHNHSAAQRAHYILSLFFLQKRKKIIIIWVFSSKEGGCC